MGGVVKNHLESGLSRCAALMATVHFPGKIRREPHRIAPFSFRIAHSCRGTVRTPQHPGPAGALPPPGTCDPLRRVSDAHPPERVTPNGSSTKHTRHGLKLRDQSRGKLTQKTVPVRAATVWLRNLLFLGVLAGGAWVLVLNLLPPAVPAPLTEYDAAPYEASDFRATVAAVD